MEVRNEKEQNGIEEVCAAKVNENRNALNEKYGDLNSKRKIITYP